MKKLKPFDHDAVYVLGSSLGDGFASYLNPLIAEGGGLVEDVALTELATELQEFRQCGTRVVYVESERDMRMYGLTSRLEEQDRYPLSPEVAARLRDLSGEQRE
jgi:hypothetical protein